MVDLCALTLAVGAVSAVVTGDGRALVKVDAVVLERVDQHLDRTGNLALGIRVLHAQKQHAAGLVRHALGDQPLHQIAQMDKAGGRGRHARDNCAFRQIARREALFHVFRRRRDVGEQKLSKPCCIHESYLVQIFFSLYHAPQAKSIRSAESCADFVK